MKTKISTLSNHTHALSVFWFFDMKKKNPGGLWSFNWLLGIRAAVGQRECDVEVEAVIGGQSGIIRGGRTGLKLPKEQPASDLALQEAYKPPASALLPPSQCIQRDFQLDSDKCFQSGEYPFRRADCSCVSASVEEKLRVFYFASSFRPLGAQQAELSVSGGFFFLLFKGEYFGASRFTDMEYTSSPKPQLSSRANAFSIAALMSSGKPSKDKETEENTIKPLGKDGKGPDWEIK